MNSGSPDLLVSVHLPKTAGSSFAAALQTHFGNALIVNNEQRPLHSGSVKRTAFATARLLRNSIRGLPDSSTRCVHGHFLPVQFRYLRGRRAPRFVTWMRDPAQRLVSHYQYWQRSYVPGSSGPLHQQMIDEKWSLETFAAHPRLRNVYAKFLWGFPLRRFDFIGITEDYENELRIFADHFLDGELTASDENRNPDRRLSGYEIPDSLAKIMRRFHARDLSLYDDALRLREQRAR